jgi:predicted amidophosphoribosyltransferase
MTAQPAAVFPACRRCERFSAGTAGVCLACAGRRLDAPGPDACPVCSQRAEAGRRCPNELCHSPRRRIGRIHAIAYQSGPLRQAINDYKYRGARHWAVIFARLLLAWLDENMAADPPDLIVANPSFVGAGAQPFAHTEEVLDAAASAEAAASAAAAPGAAAGRPASEPRWRFDTARPRAVIKAAPTLPSADAQAWAKRAAAAELRGALRVPDRARTAGRFLLVYDDVCTTGGQLDVVAGCLLDQGGANRVEAIVLARAPWRGTNSQET